MNSRNHEQLPTLPADLQTPVRPESPLDHPSGLPLSGWTFHPDIEILRRRCKTPTQEVPVDEEELFCTCLGVDDGTKMIECSNERCLFQWFHTRCIGMTSLPNENEPWFCIRCQQRWGKPGPYTTLKQTNSPRIDAPTICSSIGITGGSRDHHQFSDSQVPESESSDQASPSLPDQDKLRDGIVDGTNNDQDSRPINQTFEKVEHRIASDPLRKSRKQRNGIVVRNRASIKPPSTKPPSIKRYWTPYEMESPITVMGELVRAGVNKDHWVIAARELTNFEVQRTPRSVEMIWRRELRERSGIDERPAKNWSVITSGNWTGNERRS